MLLIKRLNAKAAGFRAQLDALLAWDAVADSSVQARVQDILANVQREGDAALLKYSETLDGLRVGNVAELEIPIAECREALQRLPALEREALQAAAGRIRRHAEHQALQSWSYTEDDGTLLGQQVTPLARVGVYVPGGKACYPSSVLMNTLPAKVAGVPEVIMVVPTPGGVCNPWVLAAAAVAGVDRVFRLGGAQAIAALAYGTPTIPAVDKIVGPGNVYVATAKRMVFGRVGIDMLAGPSEILIICDGHTNPDWIAMDLFSQAEHDENAQSILISPDAAFLDEVERRMQVLLPSMTRQAIIREALNLRGGLIQTADLQEAVTWANYIAPEHLELSVAEPHSLLPLVKNAGAIFLGRHTSEALGDYCAGPNHVLPTARTARFTSPLGVYDFQKRSSIIQCTPESAAQLGNTASVLAQGEGLSAHARSAEYRQKDKNAS